MTPFSWLRARKSEWEENVISEAAETLRTQNELLLAASEAIATWQQIALVSQQATRDLAVAWELALEHPEHDVRDDIHKLVTELRDQVAQLEEQITHATS